MSANARKVGAIIWLIVLLGYMLQHDPYSNWWLMKTVLIGSFVFGLIWPGKEEPVEEQTEE